MKLTYFLITFFLSVVSFLATDISLYAQNIELVKLDSLVENNKLDKFKTEFKSITNDTIRYNINEKADLYYILSKYYNKSDKPELALNFLKKAEIYYNNTKKYTKEADCEYEIFAILRSQENLNQFEAKKYIEKYYSYARKNNDKKRLLKAYMGFASINLNPKSYKKAIKYYNNASDIAKKLNDKLSQAKIYSNKAAIYSIFYQKNDSAIFYSKKALNLYSKLNLTEKEFNSIINISKIYNSKREYNKSLYWLNKANSIKKINYKNRSKKLLYKLMSANYDSLRDYKNANIYLKKYLAYKDSVDVKEQNIAISDIQTKYDTAQKEKDILKLKAEKDKQKYIIIAIVFLLFSSVLIGLLIIHNLKKKKDIAEKNLLIENNKIETMLKKHELSTLDAIVIGQEKERKRIAEELHDNLGSKLAVLKLHFDSFIDVAIKDKKVKHLKKLKTTNNLLNDAYQTVRSMAHVVNESEITQSLIHSIKSIAQTINETKKIEVEIIDFGIENLSNNNIKLLALRVVQETLTNMIKYSKATKASVDITLSDNLLVIIITDNGIGFDISKINKGIGIKTLKENIKKINGSFVIDSGLGNGTTIIVEIPVNNKNI